jgi:4a-hydroxytetrahydrobiopterin dehydratase
LWCRSRCWRNALTTTPDIDIRYKQVTLRLSTHSAGGLTEKDFALAQQIDQLV